MQCNFDKLVLYLDKQLELDDQLEVLQHVERCENCKTAIYQISRDRDANLFVSRPFRMKRVPV